MEKPKRRFAYSPRTLAQVSDNTRVYNARVDIALRLALLEQQRREQEERNRLFLLRNPGIQSYLNRTSYNGPTISSVSNEELKLRSQQRKEREVLKRRGEFLSKNLHLWNWTGPFMNTSSVTPLNAEGRLNFNKSATMSTIGGASVVVNPVATAIGFGVGELGGYFGGKVGEKMGDKEMGEFTGAMLLPFLIPSRSARFSDLVKDDLIRTERADMSGLIVNRTAGLDNFKTAGPRSIIVPVHSPEGKIVGHRFTEIPNIETGAPARFSPEDFREFSYLWGEADLAVGMNTGRSILPLITQTKETPHLVSFHIPASDMGDRRQIATAVNHVTLGTSIGDFPRGIETPHSYYTRTGSMEGYSFPDVTTPRYFPYSPGSYFELLSKNGGKRGALRFMPFWIRSTERPKTLNGEVFNNNAYVRAGDKPVYNVPPATEYDAATRGSVGHLFNKLFGEDAHETERAFMGNMKRGKYQTVVDDLNEAANEAMQTKEPIEVFRTDGRAIEYLFPYWFKKRGGKLINTFKYAKSNKN